MKDPSLLAREEPHPRNVLAHIWTQLQCFNSHFHYSLPIYFQTLDIIQNSTMQVFNSTIILEKKITIRQFLRGMALAYRTDAVVCRVNSFDEINIDVAAMRKLYETQTRNVPTHHRHLHFIAMCNAMILQLHSGNVFRATEDEWIQQCVRFCCDLNERFLTDVGADIARLGPLEALRRSNGPAIRPYDIELLQKMKGKQLESWKDLFFPSEDPISSNRRKRTPPETSTCAKKRKTRDDVSPKVDGILARFIVGF